MSERADEIALAAWTNARARGCRCEGAYIRMTDIGLPVLVIEDRAGRGYPTDVWMTHGDLTRGRLVRGYPA